MASATWLVGPIVFGLSWFVFGMLIADMSAIQASSWGIVATVVAGATAALVRHRVGDRD